MDMKGQTNGWPGQHDMQLLVSAGMWWQPTSGTELCPLLSNHLLLGEDRLTVPLHMYSAFPPNYYSFNRIGPKVSFKHLPWFPDKLKVLVLEFKFQTGKQTLSAKLEHAEGQYRESCQISSVKAAGDLGWDWLSECKSECTGHQG